MKSLNKPFVIVMAAGLLIALLSFIGSYFFQYTTPTIDWIYIGLSITQVGGLFMLFTNGTFYISKYFRIFKLLLALLLVGWLFAIMHWPYSRVFLFVSFIGIIINYFFSFMAKPVKKRLDYLKLLWVITYFTYAQLRYLHWIKEEYELIHTLILWLAFAEYIRVELVNKRLWT